MLLSLGGCINSDWLALTDTFVARRHDNETSGPPLFSVDLNSGEPNEGIFLVVTGGVGVLRALLLTPAFTCYLK